MYSSVNPKSPFDMVILVLNSIMKNTYHHPKRCHALFSPAASLCEAIISYSFFIFLALYRLQRRSLEVPAHGTRGPH